MDPKKTLSYFYFPVSLLAILYVVIRAIRVDITYDEAHTIIDFVPNSVMHILNHTPPSANNHILHTLLVKLFFAIAPPTLFVARLPNILSFLLYLFFSYKILREFIPGKIAMFIFLLLILNPFLLDFFGLVRGYGVSLGLEMASLYFLFHFFKQGLTKHLLSALIFASLSVLSNLSCLNLYLAIVGICGIQVLFLTKENKTKNISALFLVILFLAVIIWEPLRKLKESGFFWYGGNSGFYEDTLMSLANYTFYSPESSPVVRSSLNIFMIIFGISFFLGFKPRLFFKDFTNILFALLFLIILSLVTQFYLLGNLFIIDRSALFLYPPGILLLGGSLQNIRSKKTAMALASSVLIGFAINFYLRANLYKTATWFFDSHTVEILEKINDEGKKQNKVFKLDYSWPLSYSMRYHAAVKKYPFVELVNSAPPEVKDQFDYWVHLNKPVDKSSYDAVSEPILRTNKDTVIYFKDEFVYLFKRR